jgi:2-dehydropantoate 2-reductase
MKIAVIGPGAIGMVFGGLLADAGHETWFLHHRNEYAEQITDEGVRIEDGHDDATPIHVDVPATTDATNVGPVDLAIVLVRAHQTIDAVTEHEVCIGPNTRVLSLQNGVSNQYRLRDQLGRERTLSGVTLQAGLLTGPGHVVRTSKGRTVLGGADEDFAERVAELFRAANVETAAVEEPFYHVWRKQVFGGAIKPTAALTRLPNRELVANENLVRFMGRLVEETASVATALGYPIDSANVQDELYSTLQGSAHKSSMLQDVEAHRKTEIDDCNGAVIRFATEEGIDVPYNEMVTALVKGLERSYLDDR